MRTSACVDHATLKNRGADPRGESQSPYSHVSDSGKGSEGECYRLCFNLKQADWFLRKLVRSRTSLRGSHSLIGYRRPKEPFDECVVFWISHLRRNSADG
jgi:hypothetical protein